MAHAHIKQNVNSWETQRGVVTESFYTRLQEFLIDGDQLLLELDPGYPTNVRYNVSQYTTEAITDAVAQLDLPPNRFCADLPTVVQTAMGVFTGYVMVDALAGC